MRRLARADPVYAIRQGIRTLAFDPSKLSIARSSALSGLVVAMAIAVWPTSSGAQTSVAYARCLRQPTETDISGAKGAFQAGQASFEEADYQRAIDYWEDAYRRDCTAHALLLNLARAYELNGARAHAVLALQTYAERQPASPDLNKIQRRIEVMKAQVEAEQAAASPAPELEPEPEPEPEAEVAPPATPPPKPPMERATAARPRVEASESGGASIVPLLIAGAGGALAVTGAILYGSAQSDLNDAEDSCSGRTCPTDRPDVVAAGNDARERANVAGAITVTGVLVMGGGLAWYFLSARTSGGSPQTSRLIPLALPTFAGLSFARSF